jgi:hypothetical protein
MNYNGPLSEAKKENPVGYLLYVAVKLSSYIAWCWVALRLWRADAANIWRATGFGLLRLAIGVAFGVAIFFMVPTQPEDVLFKYIAIYAPVRLVEWFILVLIIGRQSDQQTALSSVLWCLGGTVVSFLADFASPEGVAGHFCVGRCLC